MGSQEVSKPVLIAVVAVVVIVLGVLGWNYFLRPQTYPGFQAPPPGANASAPGAPRTMPGQGPGPMSQQSGGPH